MRMLPVKFEWYGVGSICRTLYKQICVEAVLTCVCGFRYVSGFVFLVFVRLLRDVLEYFSMHVCGAVGTVIIWLYGHFVFCTSVGTVCVCVFTKDVL